MSWELASFLVIGAVLVAGFAWYERSRPPAQVVALVAALAALAIVGRVAFAAFPNVKPTTDIVIFAGYALGGAPGFAVGALAALVSNFWFGQGPWTPWQMVGWGLCGVLGAALALGGRNVSRLTLAAACGAAGILYGALLNFSLMATYGGELSWERYWLLIGRAIPFDFAHAIGNVVLALVAGPAMVRMLVRFRQRFEWDRREVPSEPASSEADRLNPRLRAGGFAALLAATLLLGALAPPPAEAAAAHSSATAAEAASSESAAASGVPAGVAWLRGEQNSDGGWGPSPGDDSDATMTCWAMLGLAAAGHNPLDVGAGGRSPVDYLRGQVGEKKSPGDLARTILALHASGVDPRDFGGHDLVAELLGKRRGNGSYENWPGSTAFAVIALRAAGADGGLDRSLSWLRGVQNDDGGWGDVPGSPSTADGTAAAMQALSPSSKAVRRGLAYLRESQRPGGGFPLGAGGTVNTQSTAWAIQGILAAGDDPGTYRRGGKSALDYVASRQVGDGHYRYSKSSDQTPIWVTSYALVVASEKYYPLNPPPREARSAPKTGAAAAAGEATLAPAPGATAAVAPPATSEPPATSAGAGGAATGGVGTAPEPRSALPGQTPGQATPVPPVETGPPGGLKPEDLEATGAEPPATASAADSEAESEDSESSPVGAIVAGLLAGGLLFGAAFLGRRGWMRWRYGL